MAKMKTVTPKMQAIRERFKNDPAKMQQATMELSKAEKINPLGGCLPILYAISMFITQKLNPQPADPVQAKMMMFMPLAFSVIFLFFPSGLVLYWVVNNLISMAQQYVITKKFAPAK
jgi:YidC/Oxa1 family membrane protein insertase